MIFKSLILAAMTASAMFTAAYVPWKGDHEVKTTLVSDQVISIHGEGFDGHENILLEAGDMEIGEEKLVTLDSGEDALVRRTEDGFEIEMEDSVIFLSKDVDEDGNENVWITKESGDRSVEVRFGGMHKSGEHPIVISGAQDLSQDAKDRIIDILRSEGIDRKVLFPEDLDFNFSTHGHGNVFKMKFGDKGGDFKTFFMNHSQHQGDELHQEHKKRH